ncbi:MAG: beta-glucosidase [Acidobacteria bacterium]|nr:beta-glucosidase [Acidobacteriota bacterium]
MGGFECSTHRRRDGKRLDLIAATRHDRFAAADYERMMRIGMRTARDGVRWHLIETEPFRYDFSSLASQIEAARRTGIELIWDFFHYGYPDDLDLYSPDFVERFAAFARATAEFLGSELGPELLICPVNEISFFSWAAGEVGVFHPFSVGRGDELKRQLVRTTIAAIDAIREVRPAARFIQTDPAIHVTAPKKATDRQRRDAEDYRRAQFHAFDMLTGVREPELGGGPEYLDIVGLNYYFHNQWRFPSRRKIPRGHPEYRPLHEILEEYRRRYERPLFIAETGIEDAPRADWFRYVCEEVRRARDFGTPVEGICLYPIVNHPGWADNRHCHNGLWDYCDDSGEREAHRPLADEIIFQARCFAPERCF